MRLALFDFDGTLCRENSWHIFLRQELKCITAHSLFLGIAIVSRRLGLIRSETLKNIALTPFRGWTREQLNRHGSALYLQHLSPALNPVALEELEKCRRNGFHPVVVSGAFDFILQQFCLSHDFKDWESTRVAFDGPNCCGRLEGAEMRGNEKVKWLEKRFKYQYVDWNSSIAFSDEISDLPMLRMVGSGFLVGKTKVEKVTLPKGIKKGTW